MTGTRTPLRIEIIDPDLEPPSSRAERVESSTRTADAKEPAVLAPLAGLGDAVMEWSEPARRGWTGVEARLLAGLQWSARRRAQRVVDGSPRRDSRVRQHVFVPYGEMHGRLPGPGTVVRSGRSRLVLTSPFEPRTEGGLRAEATLHLRGSWPALPVWVIVEPFWRNRTVATAALRSTRRLRYPRRYFRAAHDALQGLRDMVDRS